MHNKTIGIFDSGYGGLTILKEIRSAMPQYSYIYLGDNARSPYGNQSFATVYQYTLEAVEWLFGQGCDLVILACNTASAKALRNIQQNDLPRIAPDKRVLGVIRPVTELVESFTASKTIGIFATKGTVKSDSYVIEINKISPAIRVIQEACPIWVPLVENNEYLTTGADYFIEKHCNNLLTSSPDIDAVILGCTHYPLLYDKIRAHLPEHIRIISQPHIVAESLKNYLQRHPEMEIRLNKDSRMRYCTTDCEETFGLMASIFLNEQIEAETVRIS